MQLAADFERLRQQRGLSLNQVSMYADVDRNTLSRLKEANVVPRLELVERLARYLGADVNQWRMWAGHPPVAAYDGRAYYLEELGKLRAEFDPLPVEPQGWHEIQADTPPEVVDRRIMRLREDLLLRRGKKITQA